MNDMRRLAALVVVAALGQAGAAQAATVGYDGEGVLVYAAAPGEANDLRVVKGGEEVTFSDTALITAASSECRAVTPVTAECRVGDRSVVPVALRLGDGHDRASLLRGVGEGSLVPYGDVRAHGGAGDDVIDTDEVGVLHGGAGDDTLSGTTATDAFGEDGHDVVRGCLVDGGRGDDTMEVLGYDCRAVPGPGADTFVVGRGLNFRAHLSYASETASVAVSIDGKRNDGPDGGDHIGEGFATITGGAGPDRFEGSSSADWFYGAGGDDVLDGQGGDDVLGGDEGADVLIGGEGVLGSEGGDDVLAGGAGDDLLLGGDGSDRLGNTAGRDVLDGGAGPDQLGGDAEGAVDVVTYAGRTAPVHVTVFAPPVFTPRPRTLPGDDGEAGEGDDVVDAEEVVGGSAADVLVGTEAGEALLGGAGDDALDGAGGADRLDGGEGADALQGGAGDDKLLARDRARDAVACGDGKDAVTADVHDDDIAPDCERVRFGGPAA